MAKSNGNKATIPLKPAAPAAAPKKTAQKVTVQSKPKKEPTDMVIKEIMVQKNVSREEALKILKGK